MDGFTLPELCVLFAGEKRGRPRKVVPPSETPVAVKRKSLRSAKNLCPQISNESNDKVRKCSMAGYQISQI